MSESNQSPTKSIKKLEDEINRASVVDSKMVPRDVVTMNSRAVLQLNNQDVEISLVYPKTLTWVQ